ncbi:ATP-binding cassette domain-containing protein [Nonomuraea sp. NPDC005650]|uniref:ATP-binding cassette domain-containing protein n=1 Tax=Nonomuraea sp. NPDC005650 TaxID=3157045 RepID=UPI0033A0BA37
MSLLEVEALTKVFRRHHGEPGHRAVDQVSFTVEPGETMALVGESGAGKSTTGRLVLRLIEPDSGSVALGGADVRALSRRDLRTFRRRAQMVFQDPHSSLDPRIPIAESVAEPLVVHRIGSRAERRDRVADLLERVGIGAHLLNRYPAQLSGGQLQRAAIARALTTDPELIVCDEPVSALDVSIQAQVINLLTDLQAERGIAYLFITHDLALVEAFADTVAVMRNGAIVEQATVEQLFRAPRQEYTRELLDAVPYVPAPQA